MADVVGGGAPQVLRALAGVGDQLAVVEGAGCWSLSDAEVRAALSEVTRLTSVLRWTYLRLLAESAGRDADGAGARGGVETTAWLASVTE